MKYINYEVTAQNKRTGRVFTDTFYCASEGAARGDFRDCYRHGDDYTILSVEPEAGTLSVEPEAGTLSVEPGALLAKIAREQIPGPEGRPHLEAMNSDDMDFFETAAWSLEAALAAAYRAGKESAAKK